MKIEVMYEVVRTLTVDVPKNVIEEENFQAIWEEINKVDSLPTEEGQILVIQNSLTKELIYE
jgi:hypothetical protein